MPFPDEVVAEALARARAACTEAFRQVAPKTLVSRLEAGA